MGLVDATNKSVALIENRLVSTTTILERALAKTLSGLSYVRITK